MTCATTPPTTTATRAILFFATLAVLVLTTAELRSHLERRQSARADAEEPIYLPRSEFLRPLSLGYHNALADVLWFRAINYFGKHYRSDRTYPWLAHICDLVTDLDPRAQHVYRFAGLILPWEAGQADEGIRLLEKGTRALPDSWTLAYYLGFNYFFFKNDLEAATRHLQRAAALPGAHHAVAKLAAILTTETAGAETTIAFLKDLEQNVDSDRVRKVLHRNLEDAAAAVAIQRLEDAVAAHRRATGRAPRKLEDLVAGGFVDAIPRDPFGGHFEIGDDDAVRSSTGRTPSRTHTSRFRERALEGKSGAALLGF